MNESDARQWLQKNFDVSRETWDRLESFATFLKHEAASQNLVAASTLESIWSRHIVDSAQLLKLLPDNVGRKENWIDLGAGAGFPGVIIALLSGHHVTLVESRNRRIDYLHRAIAVLELEQQVTLQARALERVETAPFSVISARAFAPLPRLFELAARFSTDKTIWLLPKGRNAVKEWQEVQPVWSGNFRIEPSITDGESGILVGQLFATRQQKQ